MNHLILRIQQVPLQNLPSPGISDHEFERLFIYSPSSSDRMQKPLHNLTSYCSFRCVSPIIATHGAKY